MVRMQKRHFELIANTIRKMDFPGIDKPTSDGTLRWQIAEQFARSLRGTSPQFNAERFEAACMPVKAI